MEFVPIEVTSEIDGGRRRAQLARCTDCGSERFIIFRIDGQDHPHFQCVVCQTSYCCKETPCAAHLEFEHNPPAGA